MLDIRPASPWRALKSRSASRTAHIWRSRGFAASVSTRHAPAWFTTSGIPANAAPADLLRTVLTAHPFREQRLRDSFRQAETSSRLHSGYRKAMPAGIRGASAPAFTSRRPLVATRIPPPMIFAELVSRMRRHAEADKYFFGDQLYAPSCTLPCLDGREWTRILPATGSTLSYRRYLYLRILLSAPSI